jgi:hypothetical protein
MSFFKSLLGYAPLDELVYDEPDVTLIGDARKVILGMPGGGFDGAYSMSIPDFEFEPDDRD